MAKRRHPVIVEMAHRRRTNNAGGYYIANPQARYTHEAPWNETDDRVYAVYDRIAEHLVKHGFTLSAGDLGSLEAGREDAGSMFIRVREQWRKPTTPDERRLAGKTLGLIRTGDLAVQIGTTNWRKDHRGRIEDRLEDILGHINYQIRAGVERHRQRQVEFAERQVADAAAAVAAEIKRKEDAAWAAFVDMARRAEEAKRLRHFLRTLPTILVTKESYGGRTAAEWVAWLEGRIDAIDPAAGGLASVIRRVSDADGGS